MDYKSYRLKPREKIGVTIIYLAVLMAVSYLFFNNVFISAVGLPWVIVVFRKCADRKCKKMQKRLNEEFKNMLLALSANMAAGYSMEKAFIPVYQEMKGIYQGRSYIQAELKIIISGLEMSTDISKLLNDFAERSGLDDIKEFARVSAVAGRSGGNFIKMMKKMVQTIEGRLEVEDEIDTMITSKRMEYNIMSAMPFAIILYMRICNPGYMDALYGNILGAAAMSICLVIIILAIAWGQKITNIQI